MRLRSGRWKIFNISFRYDIAYLIFTKKSIQTSSIKAPNRAPLFPSHCLHILTPFINFLFILDLIICLLNLIFFFTYIYFPNNKKPREKYIEYVYGKFLVFLTWERRKKNSFEGMAHISYSNKFEYFKIIFFFVFWKMKNKSNGNEKQTTRKAFKIY